jgi:D-arabinose 1-dehydrogenase-like Zn-dependent alcohol dehydrogenase
MVAVADPERDSMKAMVANGRGDAEVLVCQELPVPVPQGRQVLLRVRACGVCRRDILIRRGPAQKGNADPMVLGHEISGDVAALGPEARGVAVGDRVCSTQRAYVCGCCTMCRTDRETLCPELRFLGQDVLGGYAEFVLVSDDNLARLPHGVDYPTGAIVACAVGTAFNAVCDTGTVGAGERVLISGAGGLGFHAVQIARSCGAFVIVATRSASKAATLYQIGAHEVVIAHDGRFAGGVRKVTDGRGADVAIDTVGGAVFNELRRAMAMGSRIVLVGEVTGTPVEIDIASIYRRGLQIRSAVSTSRRQLEMALRLVASGAVRPMIDRTMPLVEAAAAHRLVEDNAVLGRIVLVP